MYAPLFCTNMTDEQKEVIKQMRSKGAGYAAIADAVLIPKNTVKSFCRRNNIYAPIASLPNTNSCKQCAKPIFQKPKQKPKIFCSDKCRLAWWLKNAEHNKAVLTCKGCNTTFLSYDKGCKYCSYKCYIKDRFKYSN